MRQDEINRDLKSYISTKKDKPFWKIGGGSSTPKIKPKTDEEVNLMLHGDTHYKGDDEVHYQTESKIANISSQDKKELEEIEHKIEEVNEVERKVDEEFEEEREGLLGKFFKKLNFSKKDDEDEVMIKNAEATYNAESGMDDEELRQLLHGLHNWIIQLPADKLEHFKGSKEFELYTKYLRKHSLIK